MLSRFDTEIKFFILRIFRPGIRAFVVYFVVDVYCPSHSSSAYAYAGLTLILIILLELPWRFPYSTSFGTLLKSVAYEIFYFFPAASLVAIIPGIAYLLMAQNFISFPFPPLPFAFVFGATFPSILVFMVWCNIKTRRFIRMFDPSLFLPKPLVAILKLTTGAFIIFVLFPKFLEFDRKRHQESWPLSQKLSEQEYKKTAYDALCDALKNGGPFNGQLIHSTKEYYNYKGEQGGVKNWPFTITFSNFDEVNQTFDGTMQWPPSTPGKRGISKIKGELNNNTDNRQLTIVETYTFGTKRYRGTHIYRFTLPFFMSETKDTLNKPTIAGSRLYSTGRKWPDYSIHIDLYEN